MSRQASMPAEATAALLARAGWKPTSRVYQPRAVAEAIVFAADHPRRDPW